MSTNKNQAIADIQLASQDRIPTRYFTWLFDSRDQIDIAPKILLKNVPYSQEWMSDSGRTIDWRSLCQICDNLEEHLPDDKIIAMSQTSFRRLKYRILSQFAKHVFTVREAYEFGYGAETGLISRVYSTLQSSVTDLADNQLLIDIVAKSGFDLPRGLQLLVQGQIIETPKVIGYALAQVAMSPISNGVRYKVTYQSETGMLVPLRRSITRLFYSRRVTRELYDSLQSEHEHLERALEALRESEVKYRLLAENVHDVIWTTDLNGSVTYISPSVQQQFGISAKDFIASGGFNSAQMNQLVKKIIQEALLLKHAATSTPDRSRTEDLNLRHADGSDVSYEIIITFIRDDAGNPIGVLGVSRDITERKKLTKKLADTQRRDSLGILAGGIAHDFNNLISVIVGHADLIANKLDDDDPLQAGLAKIKHGADSAAEMCSQMLSFSGESGTITERIRLSTRVKKLLNLIRSSLPDKSLIEYHLAPDLSDVMADPSQIDQIIMNLIINAGESLPIAGGHIGIKTYMQYFDEKSLRTNTSSEQTKPGWFVCLEVTDTGGGIEDANLDKIFNPFFSTKNQGRGMGLAAVAGIVESNAGILTLETSVSGTCFEVALPAASNIKLDIKPDIKLAAPTSQKMNSATLRILVIDDLVEIRNVADEILQALGHTVLLAASGEEAISLFPRHNSELDLILLDLSMPNMNGEETYHALRNLDTDIPVVFMSGYNRQGLSHSVSNDPLVRFINKPFGLSDLRSILDSTNIQ